MIKEGETRSTTCQKSQKPLVGKMRQQQRGNVDIKEKGHQCTLWLGSTLTWCCGVGILLFILL